MFPTYLRTNQRHLATFLHQNNNVLPYTKSEIHTRESWDTGTFVGVYRDRTRFVGKIVALQAREFNSLATIEGPDGRRIERGIMSPKVVPIDQSSGKFCHEAGFYLDSSHPQADRDLKYWDNGDLAVSRELLLASKNLIGEDRDVWKLAHEKLLEAVDDCGDDAERVAGQLLLKLALVAPILEMTPKLMHTDRILDKLLTISGEINFQVRSERLFQRVLAIRGPIIKPQKLRSLMHYATIELDMSS